MAKKKKAANSKAPFKHIGEFYKLASNMRHDSLEKTLENHDEFIDKHLPRLRPMISKAQNAMYDRFYEGFAQAEGVDFDTKIGDTQDKFYELLEKAFEGFLESVEKEKPKVHGETVKDRVEKLAELYVAHHGGQQELHQMGQRAGVPSLFHIYQSMKNQGGRKQTYGDVIEQIRQLSQNPSYHTLLEEVYKSGAIDKLFADFDDLSARQDIRNIMAEKVSKFYVIDDNGTFHDPEHGVTDFARLHHQMHKKKDGKRQALSQDVLDKYGLAVKD
jgi:hypothetical protein